MLVSSLKEKVGLVIELQFELVQRKNSIKKSLSFLLFQLCYPSLKFNNRLQEKKGNCSHLVFEFIITSTRVGMFATRIDRNGQAMLVFDF